jgi:hypothetical protein
MEETSSYSLTIMAPVFKTFCCVVANGESVFAEGVPTLVIVKLFGLLSTKMVLELVGAQVLVPQAAKMAYL